MDGLAVEHGAVAARKIIGPRATAEADAPRLQRKNS